MWSKLTFVISVVLVLAMASVVPARNCIWTGNQSTSWYDPLNWANGNVPEPGDQAEISSFTTYIPIIVDDACDIDVNIGAGGARQLKGPAFESDSAMSMEIASGTVIIIGEWRIQDGGDGIGTVTISDGNVTIRGGGLTGCDNEGDYSIVNFTGGQFTSTGEIKLADNGNGGGEIHISGDPNIECGGLGLQTDDEDDDDDPTVVFTMTGGNLIINGSFSIGNDDDDADPCKVIADLDRGNIYCTGFDGNQPYRMDINEDVNFTVLGDYKDVIRHDIEVGRITGCDDTKTPSVIYEEGYTILGFGLVQKDSSDPDPRSGAGGICPPDVNLSWVPGVYAADHNIYFGTSMDDVNESASAYITHVAANSWTTPEIKVGRTYYWRVETVNDVCEPYVWPGSIWSFSTRGPGATEPWPNNTYGRPTAEVNELIWTASCFADTHKVYFGDDFPSSIVLFEDDFSDGSFDPNWTDSGAWDVWYPNDGNFSPHDHNLARVTGTGTLEMDVSVDLSDACAASVAFYFRKTVEMTDDKIKLYYWDGGEWDFKEDLNSLDPNDEWIHYGDDVNIHDPYLINGFKIKFESTISSGEVYIDDVKITNTWPAASKWLEGRVDGNSHSVSIEPRTRYHWRIDTVVDGNTYKGSYWTFSTGRSNPGVVLHYSFTGTQGNNLPDYPTAIVDNTGDFEFYKYVDPNGSGSVKYGESNPVYGADGGTSAAFDPCAGLYRLDPCAAEPENPDLLRLDGYQYTIEMWIRPEILLEDDRRDIYLISKSGGNTWSIYFNDMELGDDVDNELRWVHSGGGFDVGLDKWYDWDNPEWLHVAVVLDMSQPDPDNRRKFFLYGQLVDDGDSVGYNAADNNSPVAIGFRAPADGNLIGPEQGEYEYYFQGLIDEVRILDIALHPSEFLLTPGPEWASYPSPDNRALDIDPNDANVVLSWAPGSKADKHKVFLSTDFDDVNTGSVDAYLGQYDTNEANDVTLEFGQVYYWRVDEVNDDKTWEGIVWRFTTLFLIGDENRILWYRFNEEDGLAATDASGYSKHGTIDAAPLAHWEPAGGRFGGCLAFEGDTSIEVPDDVLANEDQPITDEITISVWLYGVQRYPEDDDDELDDNTVLQAGDDGNYLEVLVPDDDGYVYWRAGNDSNDALTWEVDTTGWQGDWHHLAFVKDESADKMYIYFDGDLAWWKPGGTISSLSGVVGEDFTIGAEVDDDDDYYEGKMDDFRIYNYAKPESEIEELYRGGDLAIAWGPSPYDGQTDAPRDANLAWNAGNYADSHDVYFGTDYEAVRDANTTTAGIFRGNTTDESNDIEILKLDTYYYWRIDEVNDSNGFKWKGNVWKFKVADYLVIDDFESYEDNYTLRLRWADDHTVLIQTGARLYLANYSVLYPAHSGDQIMRYGYINDSGSLPKYSEAWLRLPDDKKDWTEEGVKALTLFFYGLPTDVVFIPHDQMYVGIEDTGGKYAEIRYGDYERIAEEDIDDLNEPEWHRWFIGLPDFNDPCYAAVPNDVTLTDVNRFYIGFGNRRNPQLGYHGEVRFDDIRLNHPICRPEIIKPVGDFSGRYGEPDCVVDIIDIGYIAENEWLRSDANLVDIMQEPCDANLLGHWKLDGDPCDSSSYNHYGYIDTEDSNYYSWVVGHDGEVSNPALEFTIDTEDSNSSCRLLVPDYGATPELRSEYQVSVSAWVYSEGQSDDAHVVVKGREDYETYAIEVGDDGDVIFSIRDANGRDFDADAEAWREEWMHVAGTYDGNDVRLYINSWLRDTQREDANFVLAKGWTLSQDDGHFAIGNRSDDTDNQFEGIVDEVRVYDYGLDANEVAWLATDGEGLTMLRSPANFYDTEPPGEKAVNFRDIAWLIDEHWLEEIKWPQ
ncbi:MAG: LamG domain-containing protein [Planctomycetota bacterium]|jgi:hypothetical protein